MSSKNINIEYCNSWGYKPSADRLQNILRQAFPDAKISTRESQSKTRQINVSVEKNSKKAEVWAKGKADTDNEVAHKEIIKKIKDEMKWAPKKYRIGQ